MLQPAPQVWRPIALAMQGPDLHEWGLGLCHTITEGFYSLYKIGILQTTPCFAPQCHDSCFGVEPASVPCWYDGSGFSDGQSFCKVDPMVR